MIKNYEIRLINGEEILYLYIDDSYEFARINKGKKRKNFLKNVAHFIDKNDIKFAGSTIALVASGLVIGNLFLHRTDDLNLNNSIISLHINPQLEVSEVLSDEFLENTTLNDNIANETIVEKQEVVNQEEKKSESKTTKSSNTKNIINEGIDENTNINELKETVTVFRSNGEILNLELEEYLINVVAAEMPASFDVEALKAQSVLARTYSKKIIASGKNLTDSVTTQVYKDNNELKQLWGGSFNKYYEKIKSAVLSTSGEVLKYKGSYIEAVYHSTSNGFTEDASFVWGNSFPYLISVESHWDKSVKNYEVSMFFSYEELSKLLGFSVNNDTLFEVIERNKTERVVKVVVGDKEYSGVNLRTILSLRSTDFTFEKSDNGINIITKGYGHGVGMSQYGANGMAKEGYSYKDILNYYYSGTSLVKE